MSATSNIANQNTNDSKILFEGRLRTQGDAIDHLFLSPLKMFQNRSINQSINQLACSTRYVAPHHTCVRAGQGCWYSYSRRQKWIDFHGTALLSTSQTPKWINLYGSTHTTDTKMWSWCHQRMKSSIKSWQQLIGFVHCSYCFLLISPTGGVPATVSTQLLYHLETHSHPSLA